MFIYLYIYTTNVYLQIGYVYGSIIWAIDECFFRTLGLRVHYHHQLPHQQRPPTFTTTNDVEWGTTPSQHPIPGWTRAGVPDLFITGNCRL